MDAYDIFKQLTKGMTFAYPVIGVKPKKEPPKVFAPKLKEKNSDEDSDQDLDESAIKSEDSEEESGSSSEVEKEDDGEFQLMDGVKVGKKEKKKKDKEKTEDYKKKLEIEEQNRFRNLYGIRCVGRAVPPALQDFQDLVKRYQVSKTLVETVGKCGYSEPTPIQRQALPCMLEDRQLLACAPTGSGKTAAFLLPLVHSLGSAQGGPRALVLCPTRELAKQIHGEAVRLLEGSNLRASIVMKIKEDKIKERLATVRKSDIIISTPNRLCYLMNQEGVTVSLEKVKWLIIDEADKMFEGSTDQESDFRQQLEQVMNACTGKERRIAMFSATHTPVVAKWCRHNMKGLINITVGQRNAATDMVNQELLFCGNEAGKLMAFRQLVQKGIKPPVLVFVQSKDRAKQLFKELIYDGINVDAIHADRTQTQRDNVVRSFRSGKIWVLICTELLGRGMDFPGVNLVINYDFPSSAISYIHRVGRAGRAGHKGKAVTFFTLSDVTNLRSIATVIKQSGCEVPEYMLQLKQNANARKKLAKKAPRRDEISTIVTKKRKLQKLEEAEKKEEQEKAGKEKVNKKNKKKRPTDTSTVQNSRNPKQRKIQKSFSKQNGVDNKIVGKKKKNKTT